jgi:hypothetical protein
MNHSAIRTPMSTITRAMTMTPRCHAARQNTTTARENTTTMIVALA